jgi:hypothetical protein
MATPSTTIKASDIRTEFGASGANNSVSLGAYRISQTVSVGKTTGEYLLIDYLL